MTPTVVKDEHCYAGTMLTYSKRLLDIQNPNPEDIVLEDIVHALCSVNRFGGHTPFGYTVGMHVRLGHLALVKQKAPTLARLQWLFHDASEAYVGDWPRPLKVIVPQYGQMEDELMQHICKRFKVPMPFHPLVKKTDNMLLLWELENVMNWTDHEFGRTDWKPDMELEKIKYHEVLRDVNKQYLMGAITTELKNLKLD